MAFDARVKMEEPGFFNSLEKQGITKATVATLEDELVTSWQIFSSLGENHFTKLLPQLKVGQHALLFEIWQKYRNRPRSASVSSSESAASLMSPHLPKAILPQMGASNIQELAELYKKRNRSVSPGTSRSSDPRKMTIILGGMIYDGNKGVKRNIRQPNPQKVELPRKSNLMDVFEKAKELYFHEDTSLNNMNIGDANGLVINIEQSSWILENYYKDNDYKPSRHRLYVILNDEKNVSESDIFDSTEESSDEDTCKEVLREKGDKIYKQGYTLPRIVQCVECGEDFRTYVPGKDTLMPDGTIITLQEPMDHCPNCSGGSWLAINGDLFPHLVNN